MSATTTKIVRTPYNEPKKIFKKEPAKIKFKALAKKVSSKDNNTNKKLRLFINKPQKPKKNNNVVKSRKAKKRIKFW